MVFVDFLNSLKLDLEMFCPFAIEVDDVEQVNSSDIDSSNGIHMRCLSHLNSHVVENVGCHSDAESGELSLSDVIAAASVMGLNTKSCATCDFYETIEDFEVGSGGCRCSVHNIVIEDVKKCCSNCNSYYSSESEDDG